MYTVYMKNIDLTNILKGYKKGWVALSNDYKKVLFSADNFLLLMEKIEKAGKEKDVVLLPASENYKGFIGSHYEISLYDTSR